MPESLVPTRRLAGLAGAGKPPAAWAATSKTITALRAVRRIFHLPKIRGQCGARPARPRDGPAAPPSTALGHAGPGPGRHGAAARSEPGRERGELKYMARGGLPAMLASWKIPRSGEISRVFVFKSPLGHTYKSLSCGYMLPGMVQVRKSAGHRHGGSSPSRTPALCPCRDDASPAADPLMRA
jgi:hypothetical protein